ncbi:MurR/RpiR family transcriptional regulator [Paracandidimonas soli]|uniref:RpiR family transcriptional regulator n=1 Tax=Paracandidimonas soli TaxID=1917182 RepID=A0A4R3VCV0_9BURK|nr:MurR/RpiR family transcriptional regulator [Paracandidimonas soli]TCV01673.1 RpiR family transcriptional regulator [Paracandidimonas soli]
MPAKEKHLPEDRLRQHYHALSPELQRAADWVMSHPAEVGLWSMRRQAMALSVSPATMLRLARSVGYPSYNSFRLPFQKALTEPLAASVQHVQRTHRHAGPMQRDQLADIQRQAVSAAAGLNTSEAIDAAARAILQASHVGFLGSRICHALAFHLNYSYHLLKGNGSLIDGVGGTLSEQIHAMQSRDVVVAIALNPYSRSTIEAARLACQQDACLIALTDSSQSPLAQIAKHTLLFGAASSRSSEAMEAPATFFHTVTGATALIEQLLARIAALGGGAVQRRAAEIGRRLHQTQAYWEASIPREFPRTISRTSS